MQVAMVLQSIQRDSVAIEYIIENICCIIWMFNMLSLKPHLVLREY